MYSSQRALSFLPELKRNKFAWDIRTPKSHPPKNGFGGIRRSLEKHLQCLQLLRHRLVERRCNKKVIKSKKPSHRTCLHTQVSESERVECVVTSRNNNMIFKPHIWIRWTWARFLWGRKKFPSRKIFFIRRTRRRHDSNDMFVYIVTSKFRTTWKLTWYGR